MSPGALFDDPVASATLLAGIGGPLLVLYLGRAGSRRGPRQDPEREARETVFQGAAEYIKRLEAQIVELIAVITGKDREINKLQRALGRAEGRNRKYARAKEKPAQG